MQPRAAMHTLDHALTCSGATRRDPQRNAQPGDGRIPRDATAYRCTKGVAWPGSSLRRSKKALLRTTSTHGTGPSRQRPTLANPEGGGLVRDGPLPSGREQGGTAAAALAGTRPSLPTAQLAAKLVVWDLREQPRGRPRTMAAQGGRERVSSRVRWATVWRSCALDASTRTVSM